MDAFTLEPLSARSGHRGLTLLVIQMYALFQGIEMVPGGRPVNLAVWSRFLKLSALIPHINPHSPFVVKYILVINIII
jgi:hypothetical protein